MTARTNTDISRRTAITAMGATAAVAAFGATAASAKLLDHHELGWNASRGEYELPPLPYAYDALEPHIDAQTMEIHHSKHHAGYVRGLNRAMAKLQEIRDGSGDVGLIKHWSRELSFHGSGHVNHTLFWLNMKPASQGGGEPPASGDLATRINRDFGSFAQFAAHFKAASASVEGSGWGWLVFDPVASKLLVIQGEKQQDMMMTGVVPLLGVDVWEHAYYLRYQNRRGDYLDGFMQIIDWSAVERRFQVATGG